MKLAGQIRVISMTAAAFLSGCAGWQGEKPMPPSPLPTVEVPAAAETVPVATPNADAADDPAIFARTDGRPLSFAGKAEPGIILGTDKKAGLYVYALGGGSLQFLPDGLLNNVDLRPVGDGFIAGASDRGRMGIAMYRYTGSGPLVPAGFIQSDVIEPYGFCMGKRGDALLAVLIAKDGETRQYRLSDDGSTVTGVEEKRFAVGTQSEGCVIDDRTGALYIGEEMTGLWRYSVDPADTARTPVSMIADQHFVPDVEGQTIIREGGRAWLIGSSQGDSAFAVFALEDAGPRYVGRFRVAASGSVDGVSGTDGLDAWSGPIGNYPQGLLAIQDDINTGGPQNFKLVDWRAVKAALGIE
ncbi:phytase [Sphingomonas sp. FW199]|uniref:phytase n=1 Tax=Sphingomonas sp. FW199 TaxID=3400217 RepID=UPI003CF2CAE6